MPTLSTTAIISTAPAGVACTAASGSHVCSGHSGAFTAKANMKPRNRALPTVGSMSSEPEETAETISRKSNVPPPWSAVTTYRPITAASMTRPPARLYSKNFTAARDRWPGACSAAPKPAMRKYIGISMASKKM